MTILHSERAVLPDAGGHQVVPATITLDGPTITAVTPGPPPEGAVQLGRKILAPAFVNAHTHLALSALRGVGLSALGGNVVEDLYFRVESHYQPGDVEAFCRIAAVEALLAGVAVVWDHYYAAHEVARACRDMGLSAVVAPTLQDRDGPGVAHLEEQLAATVEIAEDRALADAGIVAALGPHATDTVSPALWDRIAQIGKTHGLPQHLHCAQNADEYRRSFERTGRSPIQSLVDGGWLEAAPRSLLVHGLYVDAADLAVLDSARVALGYCPGSQIQYCFPAHYAGWRDAGIPIVVGTDCGACNDGMNVQQELKLVAGGPLFGVPSSPEYQAFWKGDREAAPRVTSLRQDALTQAEQDASALLRTVWDTPGSLHPGLPCGRIAVGARANLLVFDPDHPALWPANDVLRALALQDVAPAIDRMMVNGRWLSESGEHQRTLLAMPALHEARVEAAVRLERLLATA